MKISRFKPLVLCGLLLVGGGTGLLPAQEVVSGIFGFCKLTLLGNSDTIVSIPFARLPDASALVSNVTDNVIQVQGAPGWTNGQFVYAAGVQTNTYYVRFDSGALEGRYFDVASSDGNSLTVNLAGGSLAGAAATNQISVVPYWTFGTVFVNGNGIYPTTSKLSRKTDVIIPNTAGVGINLGSVATYYYFSNTTDNSTSWINTTDTNTIQNHINDIIKPSSYFTIRHNVATNTTFVSYGDVILTKVVLPILGNSTNQQDNILGLVRPVDLSLNDLGLISNGGFVMTANKLSLKDRLLVFDNNSAAKNRSAAATYYYLTNSGWRNTLDTNNTDYGSSNVLLPGSGFVIRKVATISTNIPWINSPTYTNQ